MSLINIVKEDRPFKKGTFKNHRGWSGDNVYCHVYIVYLFKIKLFSVSVYLGENSLHNKVNHLIRK